MPAGLSCSEQDFRPESLRLRGPTAPDWLSQALGVKQASGQTRAPGLQDGRASRRRPLASCPLPVPLRVEAGPARCVLKSWQ